MEDSIPARRHALVGSILTLEREQGAALLDGKPLDMAPIIAARDELSVLDMAQAEAARRERDADAELLAEARTEALAELEIQLAAFLSSLTESQKRTGDLVEELQRIQSLRTDMAAQMRKLGMQVPDSLTRPENRTILSRLIAAELNRLGENSRFGVLTWNSVQPVENWRDHVAKHLVPAIDLGKEVQ